MTNEWDVVLEAVSLAYDEPSEAHFALERIRDHVEDVERRVRELEEAVDTGEIGPEGDLGGTDMDDPQVASKDMLRATPYGFDWGPMRVERAVFDNELGWVLVVRPVGKDYPRVEIKCSPAGCNWSAMTYERVQTAAAAQERSASA